MSELDEIEDLLKKGEKEKAFELIQDKDKNSLADGLIESGFFLIENEEYDFAISYFKFSEKIALDNGIKENARKHLAVAYTCRGTAYYDLKRYDEAIAEYNEAIKLDPKLVVAYNNRGASYYNLERYKKAIADCNKAIELDQNYNLAHANLGHSLFMKKDYDNAEKEYREAIKLKEDVDHAHNGLGLALSKRKAYKDAIAEFKKALKLNEDANKEDFEKLPKTSGDTTKVYKEESVTRSKSKSSKDADFYNNLGCAYAEYGKGSAIAPFRIFNAKSKLTKATQEKNTYLEAHKNLTHVGDLLNYELKIFLLRIFIIFFVFALSINLFEPVTINRLILILTGVATLGIVLFSLDFTKIEIKSLNVAGVVKAEFKYGKPKAREEAVQFSTPDIHLRTYVETVGVTI
jgi:tetratricopeptide (TPR) repeat protein